ncbi:3,7-dimethylxanthine N-methyltransferase [Trichinella spiralis]|uniref:3,7-dimethylxanthine N-methyltransferase n=1 Tax=Trichinella spiralis TaxID=6334 RepID=A0ABR3L3S8_TRISP
MEPGNKEAENKMEMENSAPVENEFLPPLNATIKENIPSISTTQISQNGETNIQLQPESIPTKDADSDKQFSVAVNKQNITTIEENYEHLNETHVETLPEENANLPNEEQQTQQETFASDEELFHEKPKIIQTHTVDDNPLQEEKEENMTEETTTTIITETTAQLENDMQSDEEKEAILEGNTQTNATYESEQFFNLTEYEKPTVVQVTFRCYKYIRTSNAENEQHIQESNTKMTNIPESTLVGVTETVDDAQMTDESNESPTDAATIDANIVPVSTVIQTEATISSADEAIEDFTTENVLDLNNQLTTSILETAKEVAASEKHETISPTNAPETNVNIHKNATEYLPVETETTKSTGHNGIWPLLLNVLNTIIPEKVSEIKVTSIEPEHLNIQGDAVFINRTEPILSLLEKFIANLKKNGNQIGDYSVDLMTIAFNVFVMSLKKSHFAHLCYCYHRLCTSNRSTAHTSCSSEASSLRCRSGSEVLNKSIKNGSALKAWAVKAMLKMQCAFCLRFF